MQVARTPNRLRIPRDATFPTLVPSESFDVYAQAYYDVAKSAFQERWGERRIARPDWVVWPVLFLLHHFVELELKEISYLTWSIGRHHGVELKPYPDDQHHLLPLIHRAESNLALLAPDLPDLDLDASPMLTRSHKELIEDLETFTGGGVNVRYPIQTEKQGGGPSLPDSYVADIPKVMEGIEEIKRQFSKVIDYLTRREQHLFEAEVERRR